MLTFHLLDQPALPTLVYLASLAVASLVVSGATLVALAALRGRSLPLQHAIAVCGLVVLLASPFVVAWVGANGQSFVAWQTEEPAAAVDRLGVLPAWGATDHVVAVNPLAAPSSDGAQAWRTPSAAPEPTLVPTATTAGRAMGLAIETETASEIESARATRTTWMAWFGLAVAAAWLTGLFVQVWRVARGTRLIHRLIDSAEEVVDERLTSLARSAASAVGLQRLPRLCQSPLAPAPLSVGVFRPRIVLRASREAALSDEAWRALFVHEMAHIARGDLIVGWLQRAATAIYWWNPCVRRMSETISVVREQICDDLVALHAANATAYAELLVDLAARLEGRNSLAPALGVSDGSASQLAERLRRILDPNRTLATRLGARAKLLTTLFGLTLVASVALTSVHRSSAQANEEPADEATDQVVNAVPADTAEENVPAAADAADASNPRLSKQVRVVDAAGKPIAGATIAPWAIQCSQGHGPWLKQGFGKSDPPVLTTDADGRATIEFPRYAIVDELVPVQALSCNVSHPDYATTTFYQVPVQGPALNENYQMLLPRGALVTATAVVGDRTIAADQLHAQWSQQGSQTAKPDAEGRLVLPRVPAGTVLVRLCTKPQHGEALFSDVQELTVADGEQRDLRLAMKRAVQVRGKFDASVPRPVKNGRVVANNIYRADDSDFNDVQWRVCAVVDEEGNFVLDQVPGRDLQVIAMCDGFLARSGEPPAYASENERRASVHLRPQVFAIGEQPATIEVQMARATSCEAHVVDEQGAPVSGATVHFWPNVGWWGGGSQIYCEPFISARELLDHPERQVELLASRPSAFEAKTDEQGTATVRTLPAQACMFAVSHDELDMPVNEEGHRYASVELVAGEKNEVNVTLQPKGTDRLGDAVQFNVGRKKQVLAKPRPKRIVPTDAADEEVAGVVIDEQGEPLAGVTVDAFTWFPGHETTTDQEGRFRIAGIPQEEDVEIEFKKEGYSPSLFLDRKSGSDDWTIVLTQGTWLEGEVLDPQGQPVPGAQVRAVRGPFEREGHVISQVWSDTIADDQGRYRLHLEPYEYAVQCRVPESGTVRYDKIHLKAKQQKQLDIKLEEGVTLKALVRDSVTGEPVKGITLWYWLQPGIEGTTDAEGRLTIEHMMKGPFKFMVTSVDTDRFKSEVAGKYARWWSASAANEHERLEQPDEQQFQRNLDGLTFDLQGDVRDVEIFVEQAATIAGRVVDPDGKPVAGATVAPAKTGTGNSLTGDTRYSRRTDEQGNFKLTLPASKHRSYNLVAHDGDYQEWRTWANGVSRDFRTEPGQAIEGVELQLTRPGTVRGRVVNGAGKPAIGIEVCAAAVDRRDHRYYLPTTKTDAEGRYELRFVAPGKQWIQADLFYLDAGGAPSTHTREVTIEPGATLENIDFTAGAVSQ